MRIEVLAAAFILLPITVPIVLAGIFIPAPISARQPSDCVRFVTDVTVPDWAELQPGEEVSKMWRVQNCGSEQWSNRLLTVRYGESPPEYQAAGNRPRGIVAGIGTVPDLAPGQEDDVTIRLKMPEFPGNYKLFYDITKADEDRDIFWVFVTVP